MQTVFLIGTPPQCSSTYTVLESPIQKSRVDACQIICPTQDLAPRRKGKKEDLRQLSAPRRVRCGSERRGQRRPVGTVAGSCRRRTCGSMSRQRRQERSRRRRLQAHVRRDKGSHNEGALGFGARVSLFVQRGYSSAGICLSLRRRWETVWPLRRGCQ